MKYINASIFNILNFESNQYNLYIAYIDILRRRFYKQRNKTTSPKV